MLFRSAEADKRGIFVIQMFYNILLSMRPAEMRPAATMDSAMIQQQIPEQVLKNNNRELL